MLNHDTLKIDTMPLGPLGCNCSVIYSPKTLEAIAIDPGHDAAEFLSFVNKKKLTVKWLLHTHAHFDHVGQSGDIRDTLGAPLCLHQQDQLLFDHLEEQGRLFGMPVSNQGKVDHYLEHDQQFGFHIESDTLKEFLKVYYSPGHTQGSVCFYTDIFDYPLLLSGDTLFRRSVGRTDLPGGDTDQLIKSIKEHLWTLPEETLVIPGHGPNTTIYEEKKENPFIR